MAPVFGCFYFLKGKLSLRNNEPSKALEDLLMAQKLFKHQTQLYTTTASQQGLHQTQLYTTTASQQGLHQTQLYTTTASQRHSHGSCIWMFLLPERQAFTQK
jgi:hypothetical protein